MFYFIAQFTLISQKKVVNKDDYTFPSIEVSSMSDCAKVCVEYSSFTCNSFDYTFIVLFYSPVHLNISEESGESG